MYAVRQQAGSYSLCSSVSSAVQSVSSVGSTVQPVFVSWQRRTAGVREFAKPYSRCRQLAVPYSRCRELAAPYRRCRQLAAPYGLRSFVGEVVQPRFRQQACARSFIRLSDAFSGQGFGGLIWSTSA
jgi:hypothetical protein